MRNGRKFPLIGEIATPDPLLMGVRKEEPDEEKRWKGMRETACLIL